MGISCFDGIHELGHSRISMGWEYVLRLGKDYVIQKCFLIHSQFEYSISGK
jgi:hypothetical protein